MALDFTVLETEVREMGDIVVANIAAFRTVAEAMRQDAGNQTKIVALANELDRHAKAITEAVITGTPAEPVVDVPAGDPVVPVVTEAITP